MKVFDNYEISPCTRTEEPDKPGHFYFEVCEPHEADVWTLYGHINGEGVEAIGDFASREHAEETFQRITGIPFAGSREVATHLKMMRAAPKLLEALQLCFSMIRTDGKRLDPFENHDIHRRCEQAAKAVIAEATGRAA
jgi:hypothetical protein